MLVLSARPPVLAEGTKSRHDDLAVQHIPAFFKKANAFVNEDTAAPSADGQTFLDGHRTRLLVFTNHFGSVER